MIDETDRKEDLFNKETGDPIPIPNKRGRIYEVSSKSISKFLRCRDKGFIDLVEVSSFALIFV